MKKYPIFNMAFAAGVLFAFLTAAVMLQPSGEKFTFKGKVSYVLDADILLLTDDKNLDVLIRLKGVDCPDSGQAFHQNAKDFVTDLIGSKTVTVNCDSSDYFGRTFGEVLLDDGRNLNRELLRFGLAWHYNRYTNDPEYAALEKSARNAKLGIWKYDDPVPPWVYRRDDTLKVDGYVGTFIEMSPGKDLPKDPKTAVGDPKNPGKTAAATPAGAAKPKKQFVIINTDRVVGREVDNHSKLINVYICNSDETHTYHRIRHCTATSDCEDQLIMVTHFDAVRKYHRNGCKHCW